MTKKWGTTELTFHLIFHGPFFRADLALLANPLLDALSLFVSECIVGDIWEDSSLMGAE